jgi:hypothetical protein
MAGLDAETLELILSTPGKCADKRLSVAYRPGLDRTDEFPHEVPKELYDSNMIGLQLLLTLQEYGGLDAAGVNRLLACSNPPFGMAGIQHSLPASCTETLRGWRVRGVSTCGC